MHVRALDCFGVVGWPLTARNNAGIETCMPILVSRGGSFTVTQDINLPWHLWRPLESHRIPAGQYTYTPGTGSHRA